MDITQDEKARYSRHLRLPGFGEEHQARLKNGSVLVIGLGGLGSPAALYLAAAGVGRIGLVDHDMVESHNLQRQVLYGERDVGHSKCRAAHRRLSALNASVKLEVHESGLDAANAMSLFAKYDVILDGSDNFATRFLVNDASRLSGKPLVYGSLFQWEGQLTVFNRSRSAPCYRCLFPDPPRPGTVPDCNEAGVVGALPGVIGSLQAMEAIKLLTGLGEPVEGRMLVMDLLMGKVRSVKIPKDPDCPLCGIRPRIDHIEAGSYPVPCLLPDVAEGRDPVEGLNAPLSIPVEMAWELVRSGKVRLLDVREPDEHAICQIPGSVLMPMGNVPDLARDLDRKAWWVVVCHHGFRSDRVSRYLRSIGFGSVSNLEGGIEAWAERINPDMDRY